jgi:hypothetical protein
LELENIEPDYPSYNYQPTRNSKPAYNDPYGDLEQHYPSEYGQKKKYTQEYEQPTLKDRNREKNPRQPPKPSYKPSYQEEYRAPVRQGGDDFEDRNIKEINRENRVEIREYDPSELINCRQGCGRKFNPDSIKKHEAVCKKVFQKKRKEFNAQDQRIVANEQVKLMKKGAVVDRKLEEKKANEKLPKWKAESLQLRAGIKQAKDSDYAPSKEEQKLLEMAQKSGYVKCHICGRNFNETAAQRHIPFCEAQAKKTQMRRK